MKRKDATLPGLGDTIEEVLRRWPSTAGALRCAGLGDCVGCAMASFETVAEAARTYGLDARRVLVALQTSARRGGR